MRAHSLTVMYIVKEGSRGCLSCKRDVPEDLVSFSRKLRQRRGRLTDLCTRAPAVGSHNVTQRHTDSGKRQGDQRVVITIVAIG